MTTENTVDYGALLAQVRRYGRRAAALSHLTLRSAGELTDLAAEMHHTITRAPLPCSKMQPDANRAPMPYRIVRGSFNTMAESLAAVPATRVLDEAAQPSNSWRLFRSITNGVMGDKLARWNNALALPLGLHDLDGHTLDWNSLQQNSCTGIVLFAHGLCLSEHEWNNAAHQQFAATLREAGYSVVYLRYNSGRAIHENGRELADYFSQHITRDTPPVLLIGYSMGGLLFRSAFEIARCEKQPWLQRVERVAFLATPHHGSPLEKVGNLANAIFASTPYTLPLMRLGNIRSRGIKDLRYGCVTAEESTAANDAQHRDFRDALVPLPLHVNTLIVSGALPDPRQRALLGDGLVPIESARGEHAQPRLTLQAPKLERVHLEPLTHMGFLSDARVYTVLRSWLGMPIA